MDKITPFVRGNAELISWFRNLLDYDWRDDAIDRDFGEDLQPEDNVNRDSAPPARVIINLTLDAPDGGDNQTQTDYRANQPTSIASTQPHRGDLAPNPWAPSGYVMRRRNALVPCAQDYLNAIVSTAWNTETVARFRNENAAVRFRPDGGH